MTYEEYMGKLFRMSFNGVDLNDYLAEYSSYLYVQEVTGRSLSPSDIQATTLANGNYRFKRRTKTPVPLGVKAILITPSDKDLRHVLNALNGVFDTKEPAPITFSDEPEFTHYGMLNTISEGTEVNGAHIITMTFWKEEANKSKSDIELTVTPTFETFTIQGQTEQPWTSKTTFTAANNQYTLETNTGGKILLNYNFIAGDVLVIDYKKRKVTLNGNNLAVAVSLSTNWFDLSPGVIQMKATHETLLTYTEKYY